MPVYSGAFTCSEVLSPVAVPVTLSYPGATFKPVACGSYAQSATAFTLNTFLTVIHLQLKGSVTLGKIEYYLSTGAQEPSLTMNFPEGLALNTTEAKDVYLPLLALGDYYGFKLKFYDNAATPSLIMEKSNVLNWADYFGKIINFPVLEVNKPVTFTLYSDTPDRDTAIKSANPNLIGTFTVPAGTTIKQYIESLGTIEGLSLESTNEYVLTVGYREFLLLGGNASTVIGNNGSYKWNESL